eukprot:GHVN01003883.1.p1 GENE.GHVN01003883.1~~GHVN01003883.1.p1  ORF type:complete len:787 (-),score=200.88 GHVN01003883.1:3281-5401(-)
MQQASEAVTSITSAAPSLTSDIGNSTAASGDAPTSLKLHLDQVKVKSGGDLTDQKSPHRIRSSDSTLSPQLTTASPVVPPLSPFSTTMPNKGCDLIINLNTSQQVAHLRSEHAYHAWHQLYHSAQSPQPPVGQTNGFSGCLSVSPSASPAPNSSHSPASPFSTSPLTTRLKITSLAAGVSLKRRRRASDAHGSPPSSSMGDDLMAAILSQMPQPETATQVTCEVDPDRFSRILHTHSKDPAALEQMWRLLLSVFPHRPHLTELVPPKVILNTQTSPIFASGGDREEVSSKSSKRSAAGNDAAMGEETTDSQPTGITSSRVKPTDSKMRAGESQQQTGSVPQKAILPSNRKGRRGSPRGGGDSGGGGKEVGDGGGGNGRVETSVKTMRDLFDRCVDRLVGIGMLSPEMGVVEVSEQGEKDTGNNAREKNKGEYSIKRGELWALYMDSVNKALVHLLRFACWTLTAVWEITHTDRNRVAFLSSDPRTALETLCGVLHIPLEFDLIPTSLTRSGEPSTTVFGAISQLMWREEWGEVLRQCRILGIEQQAPRLDKIGEGRLLQAPENYHDVVKLIFRRPCPATGRLPPDPALCLLCGGCGCMAGSHDVEGQRSGEKELTLHARQCGGGQGLFLMTSQARVLAVEAPRAAFFDWLYLDVNGEPDPNVERGKELRANQRSVEELEHMFIKGRIGREIIQSNEKIQRYINQSL